MQAEQKHPADELAKLLSRAGGILTLLTGCYEGERDGFALGNGFVHQSIQQVEMILAKATDALNQIYEHCDLTLVNAAEPADAEVLEASSEPEAEAVVEAPQAFVAAAPVLARAAEPAPQPVSYLSAFGPGEGAPSRLADRLDTLLVKPAMLARTEVTDRPAESYDEFLQKLTAVADRAAFQAHHSSSDRSLVPALEGLRADLIKLRGAA